MKQLRMECITWEITLVYVQVSSSCSKTWRCSAPGGVTAAAAAAVRVLPCLSSVCAPDFQYYSLSSCCLLFLKSVWLWDPLRCSTISSVQRCEIHQHPSRRACRDTLPLHATLPTCIAVCRLPAAPHVGSAAACDRRTATKQMASDTREVPGVVVRALE
jgi:hypothetical protein